MTQPEIPDHFREVAQNVMLPFTGLDELEERCARALLAERNRTIEECAMIAMRATIHITTPRYSIATAIRALLK
jgi:hypothetical protein